MGGTGEVYDGAIVYLRIAALGAPLFMLAGAGQGFLRGISDLRTPLVILVCAHTANVALELVFVYGFHWGLAGSAWGTVIAQAGMALGFVAVQRRAGFERPHPAKMRPLARIGSEIAVRTTALTGSFLVASAVLARVGRGQPRRPPGGVPALGLPGADPRCDRRGRPGDGRADARRRRRVRGAGRRRADDRLERRHRHAVRARAARAGRRRPAAVHRRRGGRRAARTRSGRCSP